MKSLELLKKDGDTLSLTSHISKIEVTMTTVENLFTEKTQSTPMRMRNGKFIDTLSKSQIMNKLCSTVV